MKKHNQILKTLQLSLIFFLVIGLSAIAQTKTEDKLPIDPNVKIGKLANGLTYYIRKNAKPEKKVELRLVVNAGSVLEDADQQGLAHFTEHMAFNGTKNFKKNELVDFLQTIGVEFGADLNAYTSFDETVYILPIPTEKPENVEKGFLVLEDWASTVAFENEEIDKERGVVLEEMRLGKGAQDRMNKIILPKLLAGSNYANRLPIGKEDILKNFKYDVIKRFYRDWYRPNLMAVIVVGDIDVAEAEKMIKSHFEKLKNPAKPRPRVSGPIPPRKITEGAVVTDKEATNSVLQIYYSTNVSKDEVTVGDYRQSIVKNIFQSMLGQRMQELTQTANPPFVFGGSNLGGFLRGHETFSSFALIGKGGVEPAINALIQENERARKFGFTASELERTKKNLVKNMERAYSERDKTESEGYAAEYIRNFLAKEPIPGIENEFAYYKQYVDGITLEEINKYTATAIPTSENKLIAITAPEKTDFVLPTNENLLAITEAASKVDIKAYEEKVVAASLIAEPPTAGRIIFQKENKELGYFELTLGNGVKVILKTTDFKNDQVVMSAFRFGGQSLYDPKDRYSAEYAATVISQMGVGDFSPTDLKKVLAGKSVNVSPRISTTAEGLSGSCSSTDVEAMMQLVNLYFTKPRKDDELFTSFVNKQQAMYQNMMSEPRMVFQDTLLRTLYKNNPRGPHIPNAADFGKIDEQRALEIYKERFANANGYTFVIVGAFELDKIKPLIATYIASLPSDKAVTSTFKDIGLRPVRGVVKKEVHKGAEPKSFIAMQFTGEIKYSDEENFKLQALIEVLNIKLIETLREELSGIYGGGMYASMNKFPYENYSVGVSLPCGPENVDKLIAATMEELNKVKTNGPSEADLNKVKETWKKQHQESMKDNTYWMRQLQQSVELGSNLAEIFNYDKKVDALTPADLKAAANKYLDMKNYVQVVLYPEK
ncbi:MAG TPA: insulinase family protein [Chryseolinea sp.]|nr:insulinase family protein [Chryseolinea sp.]HPH45386.1 insulinase family protein [Chryseolinea sp.]HPM29342.1 insulinase family protein [Chryseolinea sp.]